MQHAATEHRPGRIARTRLYTQSKVLLQLFHQTVMYMTTRHILTVLTKERAIVYREHHRHRRLINRNRCQWFWILNIAYRITYLKAVYTYQRADITTTNRIRLYMPHAFKRVQLFYLRTHFRTIFLRQTYRLTIAKSTPVHTTNSYSTYIRIIVQRCNKHLRSAF